MIGSRSALFAPAARLGLVVLDEEHEWTYKQEATPRYHAREVALELGRLAAHRSCCRAPHLTLGRAGGRGRRASDSCACAAVTAGPTKGPARLVALPPVEVVDLRDRAAGRQHQHLQPSATPELGATLGRGEQAILFINRRGTATCVTCRHCGLRRELSPLRDSVCLPSGRRDADLPSLQSPPSAGRVLPGLRRRGDPPSRGRHAAGRAGAGGLVSDQSSVCAGTVTQAGPGGYAERWVRSGGGGRRPDWVPRWSPKRSISRSSRWSASSWPMWACTCRTFGRRSAASNC